MNISDLILELVQQGDSVELKGMGTMESEMRNPYHDPRTNVYYPATRVVKWSSQPVGDSNIIKLLAERECVNEEVATQMWHNYVDALNEKLVRVGSHQFGKVGELRRDAEGRYSFAMADGYVPESASPSETPIEGVKLYSHEGEADPFAQFEASSAADQTMSEAAEEQILAEVEEVEEVAEKIDEETSVVDEVAKIAGAAREAREERQRQLDERAAGERAEAERRAAAEKRKAEEAVLKAEAKRMKAQREAEEKAAEAEAKAVAKARIEAEKEAAHKAKEAARAQAESERATAAEVKKTAKMAKKESKAAKKEGMKKSKWWLILLLLLLLLLLGGGAYYYFFMREAGQTDVAFNGEATEHLDVPATNQLTYNTDMIDYSNEDMYANSNRVCTFMADYVRNFLNERRYSSAMAPMMEKVRQYADERMSYLLGERFAVQRLLPYDDYIYRYCESHLKGVRASKARVEVQTELMKNGMLGKFLDQLIDEMGLQPDQVEFTAVAQPVVNKPEVAQPSSGTSQSTINAPMEKQSKQGFDVIAGFFLNRDNAVRMTARLHSQGCDAYIIEKDGKYFVSMGSAPTRTAADALYKHIKGWYDGDIVIKQW